MVKVSQSLTDEDPGVDGVEGGPAGVDSVYISIVVYRVGCVNL